MPKEMMRQQLRPLDVYHHLAARKPLDVIRDELHVSCPVRTLRRLFIETARARSFVTAIVTDAPMELAPAIRRLLDQWFVEGANARERLRALRRAIVAIDQMRTSFQRALGE